MTRETGSRAGAPGARALRSAGMTALGVALLVAWSGVARAEPPLTDRIRVLRSAPTDDARAAARAALLASKPSVPELRRAIREATFPADVTKGLHRIKVAGFDRPLDVFVPENYDPSKRWPLMIGLHGTGGKGHQVARPAAPVCRKQGWIMVCPTLPKPDVLSSVLRAGKTGFGWGDHAENLALKSLEWALRRYNIDTDRTYLLGVSLGGYGAWGIGSSFPHRWAAIMAYAGGIDYRENFKAVSGLIPRDPKFARRFGLGGQSGAGRRRDLLMNLRNTPVFFVHGARDQIVNAFGDRRTKAELDKLGADDERYAYRYIEKPDWGHIPPRDQIPGLVEELIAWAGPRTRDPRPESVVHFAPRKDCPVAEWIELVEFKPGAKLSARRSKDGIAIHVRGARRIALHLDTTLHRPGTPLTVRINGVTRTIRTVRHSPEAVLQSYERWWDRSRLFSARVELDVPTGAPETTPKAAPKPTPESSPESMPESSPESESGEGRWF